MSSLLQREFHRMMSREMECSQGVMMLLGTMRAEERVALFLLNLSMRFAARGYSPLEFNLRMTRNEIGSHLGLKLETVSRTFSGFKTITCSPWRKGISGSLTSTACEAWCTRRCKPWLSRRRPELGR